MAEDISVIKMVCDFEKCFETGKEKEVESIIDSLSEKDKLIVKEYLKDIQGEIVYKDKVIACLEYALDDVCSATQRVSILLRLVHYLRKALPFDSCFCIRADK